MGSSASDKNVLRRAFFRHGLGTAKFGRSRPDISEVTPHVSARATGASAPGKEKDYGEQGLVYHRHLKGLRADLG
jgi:hypothetical protein